MATSLQGGEPLGANQQAAKRIADAVCPACGCLCDDIELQTSADGRIVAAKRACVLGKAWFFTQPQEPGKTPSCLVDGVPAALETGYDLAAQLLTQAHYPLVYGLQNSTCEAQGTAASIADWIRGILDTPTSSHDSSLRALQSIGEVTCTLGEVKNRADLVVFWGTNPAESHPRHFTRYSLTPRGLFTPAGRKNRTCVVIDTERTKTASAADLFIELQPGRNFETLWILRALAKGHVLDPNQVQSSTGVALETLTGLVTRMKAARFGALFYGPGLTDGQAKSSNCEALFTLVRELNAFSRFVALPNREPGNLAGAENVLAWRTGFSYAVNHARGYPRFSPGEYTLAETLDRREVDAALLIGQVPLETLSTAARDHLKSMPCITLNPERIPIIGKKHVAFTVAIPGIHTGGTMYRLDDVPLTLRPIGGSPHPSEEQVLAEIETRIQAIQRGATPRAES